MEAQADPLCKIAKLTFVGTIFAGAGAVLTTYVPAFHKPVDWLHDIIKSGHKNVLSNLPGPAGRFFENNPLLHNKLATEFLAINAIETGLVGGMMVALGGALGIAGVSKQQLEETVPMLQCGCPPHKGR